MSDWDNNEEALDESVIKTKGGEEPEGEFKDDGDDLYGDIGDSEDEE